MRAILITAAAALLVGILVGLALYHHFVHWEPLQETTATFKPGAVQADGSVRLTRIPTAPEDAGPPPHAIPKGGKETERARIVVKPRPRHEPAPQVSGRGDAPAARPPQADNGPDSGLPPGTPEATCSCEPVVVDISRYLGPDGAGIIASSPDGEVDVSRSTYTPMLEQRPPPSRFVHLTAEPGRDGYSAAVGKRWGRVGVSIGWAKQPWRDARPILGVELSW